ncbi:lysophospholipid acyltransferase family protein [Jiulongibacter sp. NS-SX5]|uniref:lysophospholipid acyltransferase family protein n=1 Tax=Jiulongibacter sp. NS-SX5 TaxID=3463854 RepID=UPI004058A453
MPIKRIFKFRPDTKETYVFVANHFTYLDIAAGMNVLDNYFAFIGKSSVKKAPLFGYMFAKLHIQVDRSDKWSRTKSFKKGIDTVRSGRSVFVMPEGGIITEEAPQMHLPFKDGPFIMAIENQVPIVPITFLNFHEINKPLNRFRPGIRPVAIFNEKIETKGKTKDDLDELKRKVYEVIQGDLDERWDHQSKAYF